MRRDAEKITHVLKIIVENSIKFTEEGGINVCVGCRRESYGVNLTIDIYDTGIGMTDSQMNQMFDDFYQADTGSSRFAGGGLGLGSPLLGGSFVLWAALSILRAKASKDWKPISLFRRG